MITFLNSFFSVLHPIVPVVFITAAIVLYFRPKIRGWIGEQSVRRVLQKQHLESLHDVYVQDKNDRLTQIDHLVLVGDQLVIIETKNYSGAIFGTAKQRSWTQKIGRSTFKLQNPLIQNKLHVRIVQELFPDTSIEPVVCFVGSATFPKGLPDGVCVLADLAEVLTGGEDGYSPSNADQAAKNRQAFEAIRDAQSAVDMKEVSRLHKAQLIERHGQRQRNTRPLAVGFFGLLLAVGLVLFS